MKHVAVLGGGPAGAHAAERLATAGLRVSVLDEKLAWEKPCGGGITYKAYHQYPFLLNNNTPKRFVTETYLATPKTDRVRMDLNQPLLIYSRHDLNNLILRRAEDAGAQVEKTRVLEVNRRGEIVWNYVNPVRGKRATGETVIPIVSWAERIDPATLAFQRPPQVSQMPWLTPPRG